MKRTIVTIVCAMATLGLFAQQPEAQTAQPQGYRFNLVKELPATPVKDQSRSGTCWSFSGVGYLESELLRMGKGEYDLSDMWVVRHTYFNKVVKYVRMHGKIELSAGGATHDVFDVIREHGIVPAEVYGGLNYGTTNHNHSELDAVLLAFGKAVVANKTLTTAWQGALNGILDAYFGPVPENFSYKGRQYTPTSFYQSLGINVDDYVSITSFTHHPFYTQFAIEIPDNWAWGISYNVPLDEFMSTLEYAVENGYSASWGADVSEKGFVWNKGFAVIPEENIETLEGTEQARWVAMTPAQRQAAIYSFDKPVKEKTITQENRQSGFDNYETTDDHGMIITGIATDQNGAKYYRVKNSWGVGNHIYQGYLYASYPFVAYKSINYTIHKDAIPAALKSKLGIR